MIEGLHPTESYVFAQAVDIVRREYESRYRSDVTAYMAMLEECYQLDNRFEMALYRGALIYAGSTRADDRIQYFGAGITFGLRLVDASPLNETAKSSLYLYAPVTVSDNRSANKHIVSKYAQDGIDAVPAAVPLIRSVADRYSAGWSDWVASIDFKRGTGFVLHQAVNARVSQRRDTT